MPVCGYPYYGSPYARPYGYPYAYGDAYGYPAARPWGAHDRDDNMLDDNMLMERQRQGGTPREPAASPRGSAPDQNSATREQGGPGQDRGSKPNR